METCAAKTLNHRQSLQLAGDIAFRTFTLPSLVEFGANTSRERYPEQVGFVRVVITAKRCEFALLFCRKGMTGSKFADDPLLSTKINQHFSGVGRFKLLLRICESGYRGDDRNTPKKNLAETSHYLLSVSPV
jgi:hypothetical protein